MPPSALGSQPPPLVPRVTEEKIAEQIHRYDLAALIEDLRALGYNDESIEFRSNQTRRHQASLVEAVEFVREPGPRAVVTVNLGLLGPQSVLPAYFQKVLDHGTESSLAAFLNFFSHRLIRADLLGMFPERDPRLFASFDKTRRQLLSLLGLRSPSTTHWLFQSVFPELEVAIRRTILQRPVRTRGMVIGAWTLGDGSVMGGLAMAPVSAIGVRLFCDEPVTGDGQPWARAANERLHGELFPIVRSHGLFMEVALVFRDQSTFMVLAPEQFLGYEPLYSGEGPRQPNERTSRTVIVWSGEVPSGRE
jgi:hypothetical protein